MSDPSAPQFGSDPEPSRAPARAELFETGPALKRDRLLQRVRAARKRLSPGPGPMPPLRQGR